MGKEEELVTSGESANWHSHYGNQCGDSPESRNKSTKQPSSTPLGHLPKGLYILLQRYLLIHVHRCQGMEMAEVGIS